MLPCRHRMRQVPLCARAPLVRPSSSRCLPSAVGAALRRLPSRSRHAGAVLASRWRCVANRAAWRCPSAPAPSVWLLVGRLACVLSAPCERVVCPSPCPTSACRFAACAAGRWRDAGASCWRSAGVTSRRAGSGSALVAARLAGSMRVVRWLPLRWRRVAGRAAVAVIRARLVRARASVPCRSALSVLHCAKRVWIPPRGVA